MADSEIVATVAGEPITADALRKAMLRSGGGVASRFDTVEEKRAELDELIRVRLLAAAARKAGYANDPEVQEVVDRLLADKYLRELVRANPGPTPASDDEVRRHYETHLKEYTPTERARASVIVLKVAADAPPDARAAVRQRAEMIVAQARERAQIPGSFIALAKEQSEDATTRNRGGDLGWLPRGAQVRSVDPAVAEAMFALATVGDLTVVETPQAIVVLKLTDRTRPEARPLAEVSSAIRATLDDERKRKLNDQRYAQLREQLPVQVNEQILSAIGPPTRTAQSGPLPPAFPAGP